MLLVCWLLVWSDLVQVDLRLNPYFSMILVSVPLGNQTIQQFLGKCTGNCIFMCRFSGFCGRCWDFMVIFFFNFICEIYP